jgi:glycosyltransferase involved in cell wall biosynthesis
VALACELSVDAAAGEAWGGRDRSRDSAHPHNVTDGRGPGPSGRHFTATMRVLVLTPYRYGTTAGPRSSFELWERVLREVGISLDYAVFETDRLAEIIYQRGRVADKALEMGRAYASFWPKVRRARDYDAVLVNREATLIGPALFERWVVRQGKPLIYLLDDPLYIPYRSPSNGWLSYLKFFGKVKTLCRLSAVVVANSPSHVAFARKHNPNVWEIPSVVDAEVYTGWMPHADRENGRVCVGWSGSPSTIGNLQVICRPLEDLSERGDVELLLIGARDFGLPGVPHTGVEWRAESEVDDLRRLEVGLVPVPHTPWTPHKFYLKLIQYMALGIPPVATPLGSNPVVIEEGRTGFLASDDESWRQAVQRLVDDPELRERVGKQAAEVAHRRYTLQANAEKIVAAFRSAIT